MDLMYPPGTAMDSIGLNQKATVLSYIEAELSRGVNRSRSTVPAAFIAGLVEQYQKERVNVPAMMFCKPQVLSGSFIFSALLFGLQLWLGRLSSRVWEEIIVWVLILGGDSFESRHCEDRINIHLKV